MREFLYVHGGKIRACKNDWTSGHDVDVLTSKNRLHKTGRCTSMPLPNLQIIVFLVRSSNVADCSEQAISGCATGVKVPIVLGAIVDTVLATPTITPACAQ